jgi:lipid-A-disaccharide synthase
MLRHGWRDCRLSRPFLIVRRSAVTETSFVLIVAGEASADVHGARVLRELKARLPGARCFGVGGSAMREEGLEVVASAEDISVAGLTEVLFAIPRILRVLRRLAALAAVRRPAVAVLIDLPDFNLRLAKRLHALGVPVVYYISPQLWAWRPKRVEQIRALVDRMLVILPFEEDFYRREGVRAEFVGHPLVEELPPPTDRDSARNALGLSAAGPVVALLPGSRKKEIARHLVPMLQGLLLLRQRYPAARALIPIASTIPRSLVESCVAAAGVDAMLLDGQASLAVSAADAAVVCSGTATLQTALLLRPMVVVYRVSWLTYSILKRLVKVAHIALVNLIAGRAVVTELIQEAFTPARVASELERLLGDDATRKRQESELTALRAKLGERGAARRVAEVVAGYLVEGTAVSASGDSVHG